MLLCVTPIVILSEAKNLFIVVKILRRFTPQNDSSGGARLDATSSASLRSAPSPQGEGLEKEKTQIPRPLQNGGFEM